MGFNPPDPKRVEADRKRAVLDAQRVQQRHEDDVAEITRRKREVRKDERMASEIRECYRQHTPRQVALAQKDEDGGPGMIACGVIVERLAEKLAEAKANDEAAWERLGESRGGKQRKNLYRCAVTL